MHEAVKILTLNEIGGEDGATIRVVEGEWGAECGRWNAAKDGSGDDVSPSNLNRLNLLDHAAWLD